MPTLKWLHFNVEDRQPQSVFFSWLTPLRGAKS
jgi:hypothetical protein